MRPSSHLLWLALAAGACGKVSALADASGTGTDANVIDADAHGIAKVTAYDFSTGTTGVPNLAAVFINPDGTVVADLKTDASGKAQATVLPGANVTVVYPPDPNGNSYTLIVTVYDIKPGDDIVLPQVGHDTTSAGTFTATASGATGATSYTLYGPCGPTDANHIMQFQAWCKTDTFDVYAVAYDQGGNPINYAVKTNVAFNNGSTNITGPWQSMQTFTAHYANIAADVTNIRVDRAAGWSQGYDVSNSGAPAAGALTLQTGLSPGATTAMVRSQLTHSDSAFQDVVQTISGTSFNYNLDVTANVLPWFAAPTVNLGAGSVAPNMTGTGTFDEYIVAMEYLRGAGSSATQYQWIAFSPAAATYTFPALPADAGDVRPQATDTVQLALSYGVDRTDANGWDDVRNHAWEAIVDLVDGGTGTGRVTIGPIGGVGK